MCRFKSSVKSYKIDLSKSEDENDKTYKLSVRFNPNEFIQGCGVILAFKNDELPLPPSTDNPNELDKSKIALFDQSKEFWVKGKDSIGLFLPMLKTNSEVVVRFDESSLEIYGIEVA